MNLNTKLKRMEFSFYAPNETLIRILPFYTMGDIPLNGNLTLPIENISIIYQENINYGMTIQNIGDAPFYLFSIKTEEEQISIQQVILMFVIGYIILSIALYLNTKHKNRNITLTPLDELYKEAKLADRIKNVKMEIKNYQSSLRYLEELNLRNELSPDFYSKKKEYFEKVRDKLTKEQNNIDSEINDILKSGNKET